MIDLTPGLDSTIRRITVLSEQLGAINLAQGFSDEDTSDEIKLFAREALSRGYNQYTHPRGAAELRQRIAEKVWSHNRIVSDPDRNIVVTCGATEGMLVSMEAHFKPGQRVVCFTPMYENYRLQANQVGIHLDCLELHQPDFEIDIEALERLVGEDTRGILICNPCNPIGKVYDCSELTAIAKFAKKHNLLILADETYEYFTWKDRVHLSIGAFPEAAERTISMFSMGKTYSVTGWRVGYVVGPHHLIDPIARLHDIHVVTAPHPLQIALAKAMKLPDSFHREMRETYWTRKDLLTSALQEVGFDVLEPEGAYFLWCGYDSLAKVGDVRFCEEMIRDVGVAAVPGSAFFPSVAPECHSIRFTFSKSERTIEGAAKRLRQFAERFRD